MKLSEHPRRDKGWIRIASYRYAVPLKNRQWSIYEGAWSDTGEDCIAGLTVIRDANNKPIRFNTLAEAKQRYGRG